MGEVEGEDGGVEGGELKEWELKGGGRLEDGFLVCCRARDVRKSKPVQHFCL